MLGLAALTTSLTTDSRESSSNSTTTAFNCRDTRVGQYHSSLVAGEGREAASPGECRALCRAEQEGEEEGEETEKEDEEGGQG